jgi:hypothetical protein
MVKGLNLATLLERENVSENKSDIILIKTLSKHLVKFSIWLSSDQLNEWNSAY